MVQAKICGLSTPEAVDAALVGGAAFLGFIFFPKSPRHVTPDLAARLAAPARGRNVKVVAVTVDASDTALDEIASVLKPDLFQLHGKENAERAIQVINRTGTGIIKALSVSSADDLAGAWAFEPFASHMLFDAKPPKNSELPGGVGAQFDWNILKGHSFPRPHFLAGGLDPWNVAEAVGASGAPLVDVSSGVERGPGVKDPALIKAFLDAVQRI